MIKYLGMLKKAYDALQASPREVRERVAAKFREVRDSGALPIGLEKTKDGEEKLLWLVFDPTKFSSAAALDAHIRARTPAGLDYAVIVLQDKS